MSKPSFQYQPTGSGVALRLIRDGKLIKPDQWALVAPPDRQPGLDRLTEGELSGEVSRNEDHASLMHGFVANLTDRQAQALDLPDAAPFLLDVDNEGTLDQPSFRFRWHWIRDNGRPVVAPERNGAILIVGGKSYRLGAQTFTMIEALEGFNALAPENSDARARALSAITGFLPDEVGRSVRATGYLQRVRLAFATAFSLNIGGDQADPSITPVLHAPVSNDTPEDGASGGLLSDGQQSIFAGQFRRSPQAKGRYPLGDHGYVILAEPLQRALGVVRSVQRASPQVRREFVRNPRAVLAAQLGDTYDDVVVESLFQETLEYSKRVREIGLWRPKVLPWLAQPKEPWLPPVPLGITVGDDQFKLDRPRAEALKKLVEEAIAAGQDTVTFEGRDIPATSATLDTLTGIFPKPSPAPFPNEGPTKPVDAIDRAVLVIEANLDAVTYEVAPPKRESQAPPGLPRCLKTALKPHQADGVDWLQRSWNEGRSGVLLADDMGLGKTIQALAFLAWMRETMDRGQWPKAPILVVAPTGLLANWRAEHDRHLNAPGLGRVLVAYGAEMKTLRRRSGKETELAGAVLRVEELEAADWVLTTYEAVRDYQISFGRIKFSAVVFDEVQKIKTPGTLVTEAAKALNADFALAMTGTPVENRLADLWCIVDTIHPGRLRDLKTFSRTYEAADVDDLPARLTMLKDAISKSRGSLPALMMRRLKAEQLEGLPDKREHPLERTMPPRQARAYADALTQARSVTGSQASMLTALQMLRQISLAPLDPSQASDAELIASSARYQVLVEVLDAIAKRGEKALIFVDLLAHMARLTSLIQRRYGLPSAPMTISGEVMGRDRQKRVDLFQMPSSGFDAMILSPRAGGVGLTLTAANHVIHLSRWWNPAVEDQCTDRVFRIGQDKDVNVYYPIALDPAAPDYSFDRRLDALLVRKRKLSVETLMPPDGTGNEASNLFNDTVSR